MTTASSDQNIELSFCLNEGTDNVTFLEAADTLRHFQNLIYHIDAHLQNLKVTTNFQRSVTREATLVFKRLSVGSLSVSASFAEPYQTTIATYVPASPIDSLPRLKQIPQIVFEIVQRISGDPLPANAFNDLIDKRDRLQCIMEETNNLWPDSEESTMSVGVGSKTLVLHPKYKENIHLVLTELAADRNGAEQRTYVGRVVDTSVSPRKILIDTPDGKVSLKFADGLEQRLKTALMEFVKITAINGEVKAESDISECAVCQMEALSKKCGFVLKERLDLELSYDDENETYFVHVPAFNLWTGSPSLKSAVSDIGSHVGNLWDEYVREEDRNLSKSGLVLKSNLLRYLGEEG